MHHRALYLITDIDGYTPQIGRLVSMMDYVRRTTLDEVEDLNVEQLDYLHDADSNSISAFCAFVPLCGTYLQLSESSA